MRFAIVSRDKQTMKDVRAMLLSRGHTVSQLPEFVLSIGGDGTFLFAERKYPGVPKIQVRKDSICKTCVIEADHVEHMIAAIEKGKYRVENLMLLEAKIGKRTVIAINEIQLHNDVPVQAIRFSLDINGKILYNKIIADGIITSTPFGSTAYYYSVGGEPFERGIGIGFNNPHTRMKSFVISDTSIVKLKVSRGPASVYADNVLTGIRVKEDQEIVIKKSKQVARFVKLK